MKLDQLKIGHRVRVTVEGIVLATDGGYVLLNGRAAHGIYIGKNTTDVSIEVLPDLIKVGDRVSISGFGTTTTGVVTLIDSDGWHVIKFDEIATIPYGTFKASRLTKIEKKDCDC